LPQRLGKKQQLAVLSISVKKASAINLLFPIQKQNNVMKIFLLLEFGDQKLFA